MATIELRSLAKYFRNVCAVRDVHLRIEDKEFLTLLGPSGCGKTTTLNMIAGLEQPTEGEIYIDGRLVNHVPPARRDVAMVFQNYALYPHMTIRDNMAFALKIRGQPQDVIDTKVGEAARILEIETLLERRPRQLSGGQRQRVAVGRALVRNPKAFLLDEPLSNLDAALRVQMRAELKMIFNQLEATVVYVTHDQAEAMTMSDRIAVFRLGLVQQVDTPLNIYYRPANRFVATFVGSPPINLISCRLEAQNDRVVARTPDFELDLTTAARHHDFSAYTNREMVLGMRPEDVRLATDEMTVTVTASLEVVEQLGSSTILYLKTGHHRLTLEASGSLQAQVGELLPLHLPSRHVYLFDEETEEAILSPGLLAEAIVQAADG